MAVKWLNELFTIAILGSKDIILFKFYYSPNVELLRTSNLRLCAKRFGPWWTMRVNKSNVLYL